MSISFIRHATVTASTKRSPTIASGKRGEPTANLTSVTCLPVDPLDTNTAARLGIERPHELRQTMVRTGVDIRAGDIFVVGSTEYAVVQTEEWLWPRIQDEYLLLILKKSVL